MFSLEAYCRTAKLQVDGLVRSYGTQRLRIYRMRPELGPPDARGARRIRQEDQSWRRRVGALRGRDRGRPSAARRTRRRPLRLAAASRTPTPCPRRTAAVRRRPSALPSRSLPPVCILAGGARHAAGWTVKRHAEAAARGRGRAVHASINYACWRATERTEVVVCVGYLGERIVETDRRASASGSRSPTATTARGCSARSARSGGGAAARRALPRAVRRHLPADRLRAPLRRMGATADCRR